MGLISNIKNYFAPPGAGGELSVLFREAVPNFDIFSRNPSLQARIGITDREGGVTDEEIRIGYRSLVYRMAEDRASEVASAMVKARVMRQIGDEEYEPVEDGNPWKAFITKPSPDMAALRFWKNVQKLKDLSRGAGLFVARDRFGVPECTYILFPDFGVLRPIGKATGGIDGFVWQPNGTEDMQALEAEDVVWIKHDHPVTPYEAASVLEAAAFHSDRDLYMNIYNRDMVADGSTPPFYVSFKEQLSTAQTKQYQEAFGRKHRKLGTAGNTPLLGAGGEIKTVGIMPNDLQYVDAARLNREELAIIWGFPPALLEPSGVVANSKEVRRQWLQTSIQKLVDELCADLTQQLHRVFNTEESNLCIKPPDVVPKDRTEQARIDEMYMRMGVVSPEMIQARDGLEPDGTFFISGGLRPLDEVLAPAEAVGEEEEQAA